ncbi:hypothetical protein CAEBREN_28740 [Caenorhabditis brenneri]|uniref:G-protein coupled receptors family 1 profile domain-containing protein n=1 Tax=Caenorhabditis brenneri TaxID=135651 RepID=G0PGD8_CAEBE|nr:hypothetical protein CAEBREN_28740 [Caenorhabditis brenneri]
MTKSKSIKTTKVPFYYMDEYYFYGDPDEPRIEKEKCCVDYIKLPSYVPWRFIKYERWEAVYLFIDSLIVVTISVLYILVTIVLVIALVMNKKRSKKLNKEQKSTNTSAMIISMAITVFLSELSYGVMYFTNLLLFQGFKEQIIFEDMTSGVFTLLIFNSIFHVVICFFMSSQYRDTVKGLVCRKVPVKQKMVNFHLKKLRKEVLQATVLENTLVSTASKGSNSSRRTF